MWLGTGRVTLVLELKRVDGEYTYSRDSDGNETLRNRMTLCCLDFYPK